MPTRAGPTLGKLQQTLQPWHPSPLLKPWVWAHTGTLSQLPSVWARIIERAKENQTGLEREGAWMFSSVNTKEAVLWGWGKEMLQESEKSIWIILMPTLKYA